MPRRSTGCERCRKRKVRCDEQRPQCQKCLDYGTQCPGYRPPAEKDVRYVDQTSDLIRKGGSEFVQSQSHRTKDGSTKFRWRQQIPQSQGPNSISSSHVHRVQLLNTFLDLYLPKTLDRKMTSHFEYIAHLPQVNLASPLLQVSIDTLCLAEIGSLYQDQRCLQESQARYVRALPMLANEVARPVSKQIRKDHILAAITILALCELFDSIARGNGNGHGWVSHVNGAQQYLRALGPKGLDSPFGSLLFHNVRHSSMCMGFVKRKKLFLAEPQWLKVTAELSKRDRYVALYDITLQVPGALERVDNLLSGEDIADDSVSVCRELCRLRQHLDNWLRKFYTDRNVQQYEVVGVRDMTEFARLCLDRTFQTVFSFDSIQSCGQQQLY